MTSSTTSFYRKLMLLDKTVNYNTVNLDQTIKNSGLEAIKANDKNNIDINKINITDNVIKGTANTALFIGDVSLKGNLSGNTLLKAQANASGTIILPSIDDTLVTKNSIDTLTNKTLDAPLIQNNLIIDNISISGNTITSLNPDGDIILLPNGNGKVIFDSDFSLGNLKIDNNTISSTNTDGDIIFAPDGNGKIIFDADMNFGNLNLSENTISSTNTDGDIELTPDGNGKIVVNSNINIGNIEIFGNSITSKNINGDIILEPNGSGKVKINYNLNVAGNIQVDGSIPESSSKRYKKEIINLENTEDIYNLRPVKYKKIENNEIELGFIAEEVAKYFPDLVSYKMINDKCVPDALMYSRIVVPMLNEMKKLKNRIDYLEKKYI
jgi:hypothetical protein